jgi:hypothetical protein
VRVRVRPDLQPVAARRQPQVVAQHPLRVSRLAGPAPHCHWRAQVLQPAPQPDPTWPASHLILLQGAGLPTPALALALLLSVPQALPPGRAQPWPQVPVPEPLPPGRAQPWPQVPVPEPPGTQSSQPVPRRWPALGLALP